MFYIYCFFRRKNSDVNMNTVIESCEDTDTTEDIWLAVENNEQVRTGKVSLIGEKFSKMVKRKRKSINEVKLTIEKEEKIEITHSVIAKWIDTKARWMFPLFFGAFVLFYFIGIKFGSMDRMFYYV